MRKGELILDNQRLRAEVSFLRGQVAALLATFCQPAPPSPDTSYYQTAPEDFRDWTDEEVELLNEGLVIEEDPRG